MYMKVLVSIALSIGRLKFSKVVLEHILGEMGIFGIVLLSVPSRTCLPFIFIETGVCLTDIEQKNMSAFFSHSVQMVLQPCQQRLQHHFTIIASCKL